MAQRRESVGKVLVRDLPSGRTCCKGPLGGFMATRMATTTVRFAGVWWRFTAHLQGEDRVLGGSVRNS